MEWFEWAFVPYLAGMVFGIVSTVRAGRVRDPRDADGRKLPRTGDEERHAARIMRRGTIVFVAGFVLYAVSQLVIRPETLPVAAIYAGIAGVIMLVVLQRRRRRRAARQDE